MPDMANLDVSTVPSRPNEAMKNDSGLVASTRNAHSVGSVSDHSSIASDSSSEPDSDVVDIRSEREQAPSNLKDDILTGLSKPTGSKRVPSLLVWDEGGQQLYGDILDTNHYYPFQAEKDILHDHVNEIAEAIAAADAEIVIELGAGNMSKTPMLLEALDHGDRTIIYYALDVDCNSLQDSIRGINDRSVLKNIKVRGLLGTYEDGARWLSQTEDIREQRKAYVWLGSSIANVPNAEAGTLLGSFIAQSQIPFVAGMMIGVDGCRDQALIKKAYDTPGGESRRWMGHALRAARDCVGADAKDFFDDGNWEVDLQWEPDTQRFENYLRATKPLSVRIEGSQISIDQDERVHIIGSAKWQPEQIRELVKGHGLQISKQWTDTKVDYRECLDCATPFE